MSSKFENILDITVRRSRDKEYNIGEVACLLGLPKEKNFKETCNSIYEHLMKYRDSSEELNYFLNKFDSKDPEFCQTLINAIYELFIPSDFGKKSPITISDKEYLELIKKKQNKNISKYDNEKIDDNLYIKFCHCIKKLYIQNLINYKFFAIEPSINEYAICTSSVYKKRGIDVPPCAAINCSKTYNWYRNNNYGNLKQ